MRRNPGITTANAPEKIKEYKTGDHVKTDAEPNPTRADKGQKEKPFSQDQKPITPNVSTYDELVPSRRREGSDPEPEAEGELPRLTPPPNVSTHNSLSSQKPLSSPLEPFHRGERHAPKPTFPFAVPAEREAKQFSSALKHFRNREEKRETDRASEAGSYDSDRVIEPGLPYDYDSPGDGEEGVVRCGAERDKGKGKGKGKDKDLAAEGWRAS